MTGSAQAALYGFVGFYLSCILITWWCYARRGAANPC
jgi:NNP family nitrate/nitrite transporter-like MFS transporter